MAASEKEGALDWIAIRVLRKGKKGEGRSARFKGRENGPI